MRVAFAGTPAFAATSLQALLRAGHEVVLVLTQPDRPAGRGLEPQASAVKAVARQHALALMQPSSLKAEGVREALEQCQARAMVVAAYGLILPQTILDLFPLGCINVHASLLPRWRGAAPIQRALLAGDTQTGISIMQMDAGLDTGPLLLAQSLSIEPTETSGSLHDRLAEQGGECIVRALTGIETGALRPEPQSDRGVSYAHKVTKEECELDWRSSAVALERQVRALNPAPVATTWIDHERVRVWRAAALVDHTDVPGTVLQIEQDGLLVACGEGVLKLEELQRPGGRRLAAAAFLRGFSIVPGVRLGRA